MAFTKGKRGNVRQTLLECVWVDTEETGVQRHWLSRFWRNYDSVIFDRVLDFPIRNGRENIQNLFECQIGQRRTQTNAHSVQVCRFRPGSHRQSCGIHSRRWSGTARGVRIGAYDEIDAFLVEVAAFCFIRQTPDDFTQWKAIDGAPLPQSNAAEFAIQNLPLGAGLGEIRAGIEIRHFQAAPSNGLGPFPLNLHQHPL